MKRRHPLGWTLIALGNPVFRFRRTPVRVLYRDEWIRWEQLVKSRLRDEAVPNGRQLLTEKIPGQSLDSFLSGSQDWQEKQTAILNAAAELFEFHQTKVSFEGLGIIALSHGDASSNNVLYDSTSNRSEWFDFDLRHDLCQPAKQRHADDLRAFLFSIAHHFPEDSIAVVMAIRQAYPVAETWVELASLLSSRLFPFDLFHLSQCRRVRGPDGVKGRDARTIDTKLSSTIIKISTS